MKTGKFTIPVVLLSAIVCFIAVFANAQSHAMSLLASKVEFSIEIRGVLSKPKTQTMASTLIEIIILGEKKKRVTPQLVFPILT